MKTAAVFVAACMASASAFAPAPEGRVATSLAEKKFFSRIFDMDLFAPKSTQNDYGARSGKNLSTGKLSSNSYVPNGLTKEQYEKIRAGEVAKKDANYKRNVAKAGKFEDYTEFYTKRGTDLTGAWKKSATNGHKMVKTKYDWSGAEGEDAGFFTPPKK